MRHNLTLEANQKHDQFTMGIGGRLKINCQSNAALYSNTVRGVRPSTELATAAAAGGGAMAWNWAGTGDEGYGAEVTNN